MSFRVTNGVCRTHMRETSRLSDQFRASRLHLVGCFVISLVFALTILMTAADVLRGNKSLGSAALLGWLAMHLATCVMV